MTKVALVTGANQGLGMAITQILAEKLHTEDIVYLAARSAERGQDAVAKLMQSSQAKLEFLHLDVTDADMIKAAANMIKERHGGIDMVASNAAARMVKDQPQAKQVRKLIAVNNHGSRHLLAALAPLLKRNARYVMVASAFGQLRNLPQQLHPLFDTDNLSLDAIEVHMDRYVEAMESGRAIEEGWPEWINIPSKIGQVATARIAAKEMLQKRPNDNILISAVCPGLVDTAASRPWFDDMSAAQTPAQAAAPIVDILLSPPDTDYPAGQLLQFGKALPWL